MREAIFSALESRDLIAGASVLDLYAGSGALGLEAASRGARRVALVDNANAATRVARENAARVKKVAPRDQEPEIIVSAQSVQGFLGLNSESWDIALLDPPYELDEAQLQRNLEALTPRLVSGAVLLIERGRRSPEPVWPDGIELDRRKDYGDTTLWWARRP